MSLGNAGVPQFQNSEIKTTRSGNNTPVVHKHLVTPTALCFLTSNFQDSLAHLLTSIMPF